jgi:Ca-activated chloride channel family protein
VDPLKYQESPKLAAAAESGELMTIKLRYKDPEGETSKLLSVPVIQAGSQASAASPDFRFAAAVAAFGMLLRDSPYKGTASFTGVLELARSGKGQDVQGHRAEFIQLVELAETLRKVQPSGRTESSVP